MVKAGIGVRETARRLGIDEERIKRQVSRKGWAAMSPPARLASAQSALATVRAEVVPNVPTAADMLAEVNSENSRRSRAASLRYSARTLEHAADLDPEIALASAANVASVVKVASVAGGWSDQSSGGVSVNILFQS
jgi:transposase-like protein